MTSDMETTNAHSSNGNGIIKTDIVALLKADREQAELELRECEERAQVLREALGLNPLVDPLEQRVPSVMHTSIHVNGVEDHTEAAPKRRGRKASAKPAKAAKAKAKSSARLARRTPEQIAEELGRIVSLVKKTKAGLRSEDIRAKLDLLPKEMPRLLHEGLKTKALKSKGEKRATVYTAA